MSYARRRSTSLAAREHSRAELRQKLCAKGFDGEQVDGLLDRLGDEHLLSDDRFTQAFVRIAAPKARVRCGSAMSCGSAAWMGN